MLAAILLSIASLIGVLCIGWYQLVNYRYREFQKYVRKGHPAIIFIGETRMNARVEKIGEIFVEVLTVYGFDTVLRDEIYPVMGYDYKKTT